MPSYPSGSLPEPYSATGGSAAAADAALKTWLRLAAQANIYVIGFSSSDDFTNNQHVRTVLYTTLSNSYSY